MNTLKGVAPLSVFNVGEILESLKKVERRVARKRSGGGEEVDRWVKTEHETYSVDFPLDGFSILQYGNVHLVVSFLFAPSRRGLLVSLLVLISKVLTGNEQGEGRSDRAGTYDSERDLIPWLVSGLPHERSDGVAQRVGDQDYGVDCDTFCVTGRRHSDPRKEDHKWDDAPDLAKN